MDNQSLREIINRIPELKHKYLGSYPADFVPELKNNTFDIVNSDLSYSEGTHWIFVANKDRKIYYGDAMGLPLEQYRNTRLPYKKIQRLVFSKLQNMSLCGMYCIYFAWSLYKGYLIRTYISDNELMRFIYKYL
jgi:hypothetical protein